MKITRRSFLKTASLLSLSSAGCVHVGDSVNGEWVNDVHSQLNRTRVNRVVPVDSLDTLRETVRTAAHERRSVSLAGGRHAMGGQQFGENTILLDTRKLDRVLSFDPVGGTIEVEAGIQWPKLIADVVQRSSQQRTPWGISQKQTGADRLSIGGALAANIHGRGLRLKPFVGDIESFTIVDADGNSHTCSRQQNAELFRLAIGGYGLFGAIYSVKMRLTPRVKVRRIVEIKTIEELMPLFERRIADGFLYGDFQYSINEKSDDFLRRGVFSCYEPVAADTPEPQEHRKLTPENWANLLYLAHTDRQRVFDEYSRYYLSTSGQVYWSDLHQLSDYTDDYHSALDQRLGRPRGTEMITEIYVPRERLTDFMGEAREDFRANKVEVIYGTIRLIQKDDETFLAWARQDYACVIFNVHVEHSDVGLKHSAAAFQRLIDMAIRRNGNFYLTYHRHATRAQALICYPQLPEFLRLKRKYDPAERFQSDWYRHQRELLRAA
jgi:FAD/FMN-containing dehydrogenase